ncbi:uncharacterized protein LOC26526463 [Drosophila erecta]|uniref:MARVEL domain-containing protein n=1 Tax=Drosophila erecta TaxID=7220 RepID=A0A0Q5UG65_DROER|nr:uncharacterized protein LOC26526463 [Drosophila erecta]KQS43779.1 uncharacterized protein Dere_GG26639 [Drosophila erecta]
MAAEKKKHPPKKKKAPEKKHSKSKKKSSVNSNLPKICFGIAIFDLLHALYFTVQTMILLVKQFSVFAILALLGVIFWVIIVIMLLVGLSKRKPVFVRYWLIFSLAGFIADILFLLWGIATSITVDWDRLEEFSLVFLGIFIESTCIYIIHRYYQIMDETKKKRTLCCGGKKDKKDKKKSNKSPTKKKGKK